MGKFTTDRRGSEAAQCLENAWAELRRLIDGLPKAVLIPLDVEGRRTRRGHFGAGGWRKRTGKIHEIAVSPLLFDKPEDVLCTLLHEAVHAVLHEEDPDNPVHAAGCSRTDPYYHRKEFQRKAEEIGLACDFMNRRYGWSATGWPPSGVPDRYRPVVSLIRKEMPAGAVGQPVRRTRRTVTRVTLLCRCATARSLTMELDLWRQGPVVCSLCKTAFSPRVNGTAG